MKKSAEGLTGMLLNTSTGMIFRVPCVRGGDATYDDYKIGHPDMMIQIIDADAFIFKDNDKNFDGIIDIGV